MSKLIKTDNEYKEWIGELKQRIRQSQIKAAVKVNTELLKLYWSIGGDIVRLKAEAKWGDGIIEQLSQDLKTNFPDMSGFSSRNLWYMKNGILFILSLIQNCHKLGRKVKVRNCHKTIQL